MDRTSLSLWVESVMYSHHFTPLLWKYTLTHRHMLQKYYTQYGFSNAQYCWALLDCTYIQKSYFTPLLKSIASSPFFLVCCFHRYDEAAGLSFRPKIMLIVEGKRSSYILVHVYMPLCPCLHPHVLGLNEQPSDITTVIRMAHCEISCLKTK